MVHHRLNSRTSHPNVHINFITALPMPSVTPPFSEEDALHLLKGLAAQVRPVMKSHGFTVNSFEEYEYNRVFAGRNWNAGETIELVLRNADGTFVPAPWLVSVLCHELAHIKHMNHGHAFQRLWAQLRAEVRALQARGYFGDGYWSSGQRLSDSTRVVGDGVDAADFPEYVCGGAQTRSRPTRTRTNAKRRRRVEAGPSNRTGRQTEKKRKPGTRIRAKGKFTGDGQALNADISDAEEKKKGVGFRKKAGSNKAREERALAAEKRMKALQSTSASAKQEDQSPSGDSVTEEDSEYDDEAFEQLEAETDDRRRQIMQDTMQADELDGMRKYMAEFFSREASSSKERDKELEEVEGTESFKRILDVIEISDDDDTGDIHDIGLLTNPVISRSLDAGKSTDKKRNSDLSKLSGIGMGRILQEEIATRKRERLGLTGEQKLGSGSGTRRSSLSMPKPQVTKADSGTKGWSCLVCTLDNRPEHLACGACRTPRGDVVWAG